MNSRARCRGACLSALCIAPFVADTRGQAQPSSAPSRVRWAWDVRPGVVFPSTALVHRAPEGNVRDAKTSNIGARVGGSLAGAITVARVDNPQFAMGADVSVESFTLARGATTFGRFTSATTLAIVEVAPKKFLIGTRVSARAGAGLNMRRAIVDLPLYREGSVGVSTMVAVGARPAWLSAYGVGWTVAMHATRIRSAGALDGVPGADPPRVTAGWMRRITAAIELSRGVR